MLLKLDENLGKRCASVFRAFGQDVATVLGQNLSGTDDRKLICICHAEGRALVTLDLDFSNPFEFPPGEYSGLAVIRRRNLNKLVCLLPLTAGIHSELSGTDDRKLICICHAEGRALVTLDLDFSNPFEFPPGEYSGLAVIRLKSSFTFEELEQACQHLLNHLLSEIFGLFNAIEFVNTNHSNQPMTRPLHKREASC